MLSSPQDLFFKYTWNNFLHFQVELCIAAILSHAAREDRAEASRPESGVEPLPGSGDPETPQPAASRLENTMVTHVSPGSVLRVPACRPCPACVAVHSNKGCPWPPRPSRARCAALPPPTRLRVTQEGSMFARAAVLGDQGQGPEGGALTRGVRAPNAALGSPSRPVHCILSSYCYRERSRREMQGKQNVFRSHEKMF